MHSAAELPDITSIPPDLILPPIQDGMPGPGKHVRQTLPDYRDTLVYHGLYLPVDWSPGLRFPVIIEYPGNGPYSNQYGDISTGQVEDARLGYGISGGEGYIWLTLPCISPDRRSNQCRWWGDVEATAAYCLAAVALITNDYGGDLSALFIAGFSRGAIACNFIGLHDDRIAALWRGFICHSHYDGVREWPYPGSDRKSAANRLARLKNRPQFISQEGSVEDIRSYLDTALPAGNIALVPIPYRNHTDLWVLRDLPERAKVRAWLNEVLGAPSTL